MSPSETKVVAVPACHTCLDHQAGPAKPDGHLRGPWATPGVTQSPHQLQLCQCDVLTGTGLHDGRVRADGANALFPCPSEKRIGRGSQSARKGSSHLHLSSRGSVPSCGGTEPHVTSLRDGKGRG